MGNGEKILTSKMYRTRARAIRAARKFIARLAGPVLFTYWNWKGTTPTHEVELIALGRQYPGKHRGKLEQITERIGFPGDGDLIADV